MRYLRPSTLAETLAALDDGGLPLGGGTALLIRDAAGVGAEQVLIDLQTLPALNDLTIDGAFLSIGAMVTLARVAASPLVAASCGALLQAALTVGNPNVRRVATIAGNLAWPNGDLHAALLVLDAIVVCGVGREIAARTIIEGGVPRGSLVTSIRLPQDSARRSAFLKFAWRAASGKTIVAVAASIAANGGLPRLAAAGVAAHATRLTGVETFLSAKRISAMVIEEAAHIAASELPFEITIPPAEDYRRRLVAEGVRRVLAGVGHE